MRSYKGQAFGVRDCSNYIIAEFMACRLQLDGYSWCTNVA